MIVARFGYLGPEGTFTESALRTLPAAAEAELIAYPTVPSALDGVRRGEVAAAMVPIENSVEGAVTATLDELATGDPLMVTREVHLPVAFALLARPGTALSAVRGVGTHPHALAQCRRWLARTLPDAALIAATSTAAAAAAVAAGESSYDAALTAPVAVEHYPLEVLADNIADNRRAVTRFVLVGRPAAPPAPTGTDKTTVVAYIRDDRPGALLEILTEFAVRGVNLTRIESRPTGDRLGDYHFSIDCEGHVADARVGEALMGLRRVCADVRFLGSYPRADKVAPTVRPGTSGAEFADAQAWLAGIRAGNA
ncbi:MAG TPA: prephenate dehydratase [Actinomycetes bacterium]|nr:prephenate dehydratase [Actinomycetes bacterium]